MEKPRTGKDKNKTFLIKEKAKTGSLTHTESTGNRAESTAGNAGSTYISPKHPPPRPSASCALVLSPFFRLNSEYSN